MFPYQVGPFFVGCLPVITGRLSNVSLAPDSGRIRNYRKRSMIDVGLDTYLSGWPVTHGLALRHRRLCAAVVMYHDRYFLAHLLPQAQAPLLTSDYRNGNAKNCCRGLYGFSHLQR
jgi:hypothetical protein